MSNSKNILKALIAEDVIEAKNLINEALLSKLGNALEEKLVEYAPTVFNEEKEGRSPTNEKEAKLAAMTPPKNKITRGDVIVGAKKSKSKKNQNKDDKDDLNESSDDALIESFEQEVFEIVQEIQEETGEELTEEEIKEIAEEYLQILESTEE